MQELFKTYISKTLPFKNYLKKLRYQKISQISKFLKVIYKNTREIYTFYIKVIIFYIIVLFFYF